MNMYTKKRLRFLMNSGCGADKGIFIVILSNILNLLEYYMTPDGTIRAWAIDWILNLIFLPAQALNYTCEQIVTIWSPHDYSHQFFSFRDKCQGDYNAKRLQLQRKNIRNCDGIHYCCSFGGYCFVESPSLFVYMVKTKMSIEWKKNFNWKPKAA